MKIKISYVGGEWISYHVKLGRSGKGESPAAAFFDLYGAKIKEVNIKQVSYNNLVKGV